MNILIEVYNDGGRIIFLKDLGDLGKNVSGNLNLYLDYNIH